MIKILIIVLFLLALAGLACGFLFLLKDPKDSTRLLTSLKFRVGFCLLLILVLVYGFWSGELISNAPWQDIHQP
jgi:uncharacterized protein YneF (UPF0154 family)